MKYIKFLVLITCLLLVFVACGEDNKVLEVNYSGDIAYKIGNSGDYNIEYYFNSKSNDNIRLVKPGEYTFNSIIDDISYSYRVKYTLEKDSPDLTDYKKGNYLDKEMYLYEETNIHSFEELEYNGGSYACPAGEENKWHYIYVVDDENYVTIDVEFIQLYKLDENGKFLEITEAKDLKPDTINLEEDTYNSIFYFKVEK